ncbi:piggyBac transposable element-derived protein 4-like [Xyrichtys novacula]|uniref:PiggyBac transposable element-derived protein 4-like n=1 Tax=Xyrichtys novacula TaxID=13765 RepID=A0AAV1EIN6_XYRNO|nr:piggyBac transposable element-derived protein 4-like [Xyrichtys novacula]
MDPTFKPPDDGNEVESDGSGSNGEDSHEEIEVEGAASASVPQQAPVPLSHDWCSKSGDKWSSNPVAPSITPNPIPMPGVTRHAQSRIQEVEDAFLYFLSEEILNKIAGYTNLEGCRRYQNWHPTDTVEIKALVGVQLLAGVFRSRGESSQSLWSGPNNRAIFSAVMSLKRFQQLLGALRFDDREDRVSRLRGALAGDPDKFAPIREIWEMWVPRLAFGFNPGERVCVDEQLVAIRGRCSFRQYMPSKPAKYGLKMWVLCDVETSYALYIQPYLGKASPSARPEKEQGKRVVLDLVAGLPRGHTVTTDNFFTRALGKELLSHGILLLGTLRQHKPEIPMELKKIRPQNSSLFGFNDMATVVSYIPKKGKNIFLLSTKHRDGATALTPPYKPAIITDYNKSKGAVDTLDQLVGTYTSRRKSNRWPMAVWGNILDISAYNALVLWLGIDPRWGQGKLHRRRLFLEQLGTALVREQIARRSRVPRAPNSSALVLSTQEAASRPSKARCYMCPVKKRLRCSNQCNICKSTTCMEHSVRVCCTCIDNLPQI